MANKIIPGCGFHHLALKVRDFDKSYRFYTEVLGFSCRVAWGAGEKRAALLDYGNGTYLELFAGAPDGLVPAGSYFHVALTTTDVDAAYAAALAGGATEEKAPCDICLSGTGTDVPARIAFVKGFDGESVEFFCEK